MTTRVAVLGDVHGNGPALSAALQATRAADRLVFLGDLLSYGPDVEAVLQFVDAALASHEVVLVRGNHDALYEGLAAGRSTYLDTLPAWIAETVRFTAAALDMSHFRRLPWTDEYRLGTVLFAHANPFGVSDWTYLNSLTIHAHAARVLRARSLCVGVFGHTHRARCYHHTEGAYRLDRAPTALHCTWSQLRVHPCVLNAGSIGQPRDDETTVYVLWLTLDDDRFTARFEPISYDPGPHIRSLQRLPLSGETRRRLLDFHHAGLPR